MCHDSSSNVSETVLLDRHRRSRRLAGNGPDEVLCLVRDGILAARGRGCGEMAVRAAEVKSLAQCFAQASSISKRLTDAGAKRQRTRSPRASRSTVLGTTVSG